jgi:ATP-dependent DNA helicase PIF1
LSTIHSRHVCKDREKNIIEAIILNGKFRGENILIPRILIIPTDVPIQFKRLQFQIRLAFAMTSNKFQGQTMSVCGSDLITSCFSHGERWDNKKYCTLCRIKGLILFFTNIDIISDIYEYITLKNQF